MKILEQKDKIQKLIDISDHEIENTFNHISKSIIKDEHIAKEMSLKVYFSDKVTEEPQVCEQIKSASQGVGFTMDSEPQTGALLRLLAASKPGGTFLELGTGYGYGVAWLLDGMDNQSKLTSVEYNPEIVKSARKNFNDSRLSLVEADSMDHLRNEISPDSIDLIFADAFAGKYYALDETIECLKIGGFYVVDDLRYLEEWPMEFFEINRRVRQLIEDHPSLTTLSLDWSTGLIIGVKT